MQRNKRTFYPHLRGLYLRNETRMVFLIKFAPARYWHFWPTESMNYSHDQMEQIQEHCSNHWQEKHACCLLESKVDSSSLDFILSTKKNKPLFGRKKSIR
jgi:hypothetical protein